MESKKNVGIWIRVSTDLQVQGDSPEHHEKRAQLYAEAKGWEVISVYRLDAMSGKSVKDYPETKRMLKDIQEGKISGLIFSKLARLARNTKELLEFAEIFRTYNADLISLAESIDTSTPAGRLFYTMIAAMAQWEREEIVERITASVPIRARMGKRLGGHSPLGYRWEGNEFLVDETEAPVRKLLYEIFAKNKRKKRTATELNNLGYRTRNGSKFTDTTVVRLLRDTTAKGIRRANYTKTIESGKRWVMRPQSEWVELPCAPIVSEELWNECNAILLQQEQQRTPKGPKTVHLLSGYVHCTCGSKMYVFTESPVYKCKKCKKKIAVTDLDEIFHEQLKSFLLADVDLATIMEQSSATCTEKESLLKTITTDQQKLRKKMNDLVTLRLDGEISKDEFAVYFKPLEEQVRQLENQIPVLQAEIDFLKIESLSSETVHEEAKDLYHNWKNLPFDEKRAIIETITEKIIIDADSIDISLSYLPAPHLSINAGKRQCNN